MVVLNFAKTGTMNYFCIRQLHIENPYTFMITKAVTCVQPPLTLLGGITQLCPDHITKGIYKGVAWFITMPEFLWERLYVTSVFLCHVVRTQELYQNSPLHTWIKQWLLFKFYSVWHIVQVNRSVVVITDKDGLIFMAAIFITFQHHSLILGAGCGVI